jgi:hypothetical protein
MLGLDVGRTISHTRELRINGLSAETHADMCCMCGMVRIVEDDEEAERTLQTRLGGIEISWISRWMRLCAE